MQFKVASPCKRDWSKMKGDEKVRFCGDCQMNVYNFSAMSQAEVLSLVKEREGKLCARFYTRPDGTVLTRDCSIGVARKRRTYTFSFAAIAALFTAPLMISDESCRIANDEVIRTSPSLKRYPEETFGQAYERGRQRAIDETGMLESAFPYDPPFSVAQALDSRFLPGEPFAPWDVIRD